MMKVWNCFWTSGKKRWECAFIVFETDFLNGRVKKCDIWYFESKCWMEYIWKHLMCLLCLMIDTIVSIWCEPCNLPETSISCQFLWMENSFDGEALAHSTALLFVFLLLILRIKAASLLLMGCQVLLREVWTNRMWEMKYWLFSPPSLFWYRLFYFSCIFIPPLFPNLFQDYLFPAAALDELSCSC